MIELEWESECMRPGSSCSKCEQRYLKCKCCLSKLITFFNNYSTENVTVDLFEWIKAFRTFNVCALQIRLVCRPFDFVNKVPKHCHFSTREYEFIVVTRLLTRSVRRRFLQNSQELLGLVGFGGSGSGKEMLFDTHTCLRAPRRKSIKTFNFWLWIPGVIFFPSIAKKTRRSLRFQQCFE